MSGYYNIANAYDPHIIEKCVENYTDLPSRISVLRPSEYQHNPSAPGQPASWQPKYMETKALKDIEKDVKILEKEIKDLENKL